LLEIVGFWTPGYLQEKLRHLMEMPHTPLVLCIDRALNCSSGDLPSYARVVWFHKRIDPGEVLAAIESALSEKACRIERVDLGDLFIDWAGRKPTSDPVHRRLAALEAGTAVRFRRDGNSIALEAEDGPVAVLSKPGIARWAAMLDRIVLAKVAAVVERQSSQTAFHWRALLRCVRWRVPVVEVFLQPSTAGPCPSRPPPELSSSSTA
jgi:hypothetical protein